MTAGNRVIRVRQMDMWNELLHHDIVQDIVAVDRINEYLFCFALQHRRQHSRIIFYHVSFCVTTHTLSFHYVC